MDPPDYVLRVQFVGSSAHSCQVHNVCWIKVTCELYCQILIEVEIPHDWYERHFSFYQNISLSK